MVQANVGNRTDKDTVINLGLDLGIVEIGKTHDFRDMFSESDVTVLAGATHADLPSGTFHLTEVRFIDGLMSYPMMIRDKKWLVDRFPNVGALAQGKPIYGYVSGGMFYLYPLPDSTYTLRMTITKLPVAFTSDSVEIPLNGLDLTLIAFATSFLCKSLQMFEEAREWDSLFRSALGNAIQADRKNHSIHEAEGFSIYGDKFKLPSDIARDAVTGVVSGTIDW